LSERQLLGLRGERIAERYLRRLGLRRIARNYRCPAGEIDLVFSDGPTLVFVEVKTRSSDVHTDPETAVHGHKRRALVRAAKYFISRYRQHERPARFDVVAIVRRSWLRAEIEHFRDAFQPLHA
jgi:putative endonuclease